MDKGTISKRALKSLYTTYAVVIFVSATILLAYAYNSWRDIVTSAEEDLSVSMDITQSIVHNDIMAIDFILSKASARIADTDSQSSAETDAYLRVLAAGVSGVSALFILDEDGNLTNASVDAPTNKISFADRDYFKRAITSPDDKTFITGSILSRVLRSYQFYLSRPIFDWKRNRIGVAVASVSAESLSNHLSTVRQNQSLVVAVLTPDLRLIARAPTLERLYDVDLSSSPALKDLAFEDGGETVKRVSAISNSTAMHLVMIRGAARSNVIIAASTPMSALYYRFFSLITPILVIYVSMIATGIIGIYIFSRRLRAFSSIEKSFWTFVNEASMGVARFTPNGTPVSASTLWYPLLNKLKRRLPEDSTIFEILESFGASDFDLRALSNVVNGEILRHSMLVVNSDANSTSALRVMIFATHSETRSATEICMILEDISDAYNVERNLRDSLLVDAATEVLNRQGLIKHLNSEPDISIKYQYLIVFCISNYDEILEFAGTDHADDFLRVFVSKFRKLAPNDIVLARLKGGEFAAVIPHTSFPDGEPLEHLRAVISTPIMFDGHSSAIRFMMGVVACDNVKDGTSFLSDADTAFRYARRAGWGSVIHYSPTMNLQGRERWRLQEALSEAIREDQLFLVYQPKISLDAHVVTGVEALVRWNHPLFNTITPDRFIGASEECGLIVAIGEKVIYFALNQLARWKNMGFDISISINISWAQIQRSDVIKYTLSVLHETNISPHDVIFEITESQSAQNSEEAIAFITAAKEHGFLISVDDFGTGYSSLSSIRSMNFDEIKIDKSFISKCRSDKVSLEIVKAVTSIATLVGADVVAEGVEDVDVAHFVRELGCHSAQGYFFGRPMETCEFEAWMSSRRTT